MKGVIGRFFLLWFYLKNSQIRKRVKIRSLLFHFFLKKCDKIASKYILDVVEEGDFNKYKFSENLYPPKIQCPSNLKKCPCLNYE